VEGNNFWLGNNYIPKEIFGLISLTKHGRVSKFRTFLTAISNIFTLQFNLIKKTWDLYYKKNYSKKQRANFLELQKNKQIIWYVSGH